MSQTGSSRYQRSVGGMAVAMVVAVAVAIGWYYLGRPNEDARPIKSVEWANWVKSARADGKLAALAPTALPKGWVARAASYQSGSSPHWYLRMLTGSGTFVGLEESLDSADDLIEEYVDENASQGEDVTIDGVTWQTYTDSGGDYAVVRTLTAPSGERERILVYGSAADADIRDFAGSLSADSTPAS